MSNKNLLQTLLEQNSSKKNKTPATDAQDPNALIIGDTVMEPVSLNCVNPFDKPNIPLDAERPDKAALARKHIIQGDTVQRDHPKLEEPITENPEQSTTDSSKNNKQ